MYPPLCVLSTRLQSARQFAVLKCLREGARGPAAWQRHAQHPRARPDSSRHRSLRGGAFRQLRLPALIGYLLVGILIGPHALGWAADDEQTRYLAEFGVVFLMFSVGLEFSLPKLVTMRKVGLRSGRSASCL